MRRLTGYFLPSGIILKKCYCLFVIVYWFVNSPCLAQHQKLADSLKGMYQQGDLKDTALLHLLSSLSFNEITDLKQAKQYAQELINLSKAADNDFYLYAGYYIKGTKERLLDNLDSALADFFTSAKIAMKLKDAKRQAQSYSAVGDVYSVAKAHNTAMNYYNSAIALLRLSKKSISLASALNNAGDEFLNAKQYDSALLYCNEARAIFDSINYPEGKAYTLGEIGTAYVNMGKNDLAEKNINEAIAILEHSGDSYAICNFLLSMSDVYKNKGDYSTAVTYARKSLQLATQSVLKEQIADANHKLSELYEQSGDTRGALAYYKDYITYRDSVNNINNVQAMADLRFNYEVSQKQLEIDKANQRAQHRKNLLIYLGITLASIIVILGISIRNNRNKQKAYEILNKQKQETETQKLKAEQAFKDLQSTQKQLVQSEKMASLGQLTAGIAHEIQNPLNFINNFSDLNKELVDELLAENGKTITERDESLQRELLINLKDNEEKINQHGRRADAIVKGMLQHSRQSSGERELTDVNALVGEFLKLSYHGLRAKDKNLNVTMVTSFDKSIDKIQIAPQEIGRVLLNLYNNAFYAVTEKKSLIIEGYEPTVWVTTIKKDHSVEIKIRDNGTGIPNEKMDKIFQPFYTTKPAGEGTGLGLSLSYDLIKVHDGEITVNSEEGHFTEFVISLPV